jgi:P27 family predicted phage terminase small subunit
MEKWQELAPLLVQQGILADLDRTTLEALCSCWGLYREAAAVIYRPRGRRRTLESYLAGRNSQTAPELALARAMLQLYKSFLAEFGLSPASRGKITTAPKEQEKDPMEDLLDAD